MKLLGNTVLLRPLPQPDRTESGILYSMPYRDDHKQWIVEAVGPGRRLKDGTTLLPEVRPGDRCLCNVGIGNRCAFDDGRVIVEADQIELIWKWPKRPR